MFLIPLALLLVLPAVGSAQMGNDSYIELLRANLRADKVSMMTLAMNLPDEQAQVFSPIYRDYMDNLAKIGDARVQVIKEYAAAYPTVTDEQAESWMDTIFTVNEQRLKLLKKTFGTVSKDLSPSIAAKFVQVENALNLLIDLQVASEIPLLEPVIEMQKSEAGEGDSSREGH
jgi:hypothetical protein